MNEKKVNFKHLVELAEEMDTEDSMACVISTLALEDIPMTDAVIKLGITMGILLPGYYNGWSEEISKTP